MDDFNSIEKERKFVEEELTRICNLLELERPMKVILKNVGIKSPIPKTVKNGKEIILYKRGIENYTWQIGQAFLKVFKKRPQKWIYRHPSIILAFMTFLPITFLFLVAFLYQFGLFVVIFGALSIPTIHLLIAYKLSFVYVPQIKTVAEAMVRIGAWKEDEANLEGKNYQIFGSSLCIVMVVLLIMFLMITVTIPH